MLENIRLMSDWNTCKISKKNDIRRIKSMFSHHLIDKIESVATRQALIILG